MRIVGPVGIELRGLAPFGSQELAGPRGQFDTSVWLAGGGLVLAPRTAARVAFDVGAGALAVMVRSSGTRDRRCRRDRHLRARRRPPSASARAGRSASKCSGSTALWPIIITDRQDITLADRQDIATWGLGFISALAGIELAI